MSTLAKLLDRNVLRTIAGGRSFERGEEYFSGGCVRGLTEHAETITAKVQGTHDYRVKLWIKRAGLREEKHPQDALEIHQVRIEPALNLTNDEGCRRAVEFLRIARGLMARLDRSAEFACYLESIRTTYKRKRNFIKMLDRGIQTK